MTNNLQLQDVYSIRGLTHGTTYDLKVANIKYYSTLPSLQREDGKDSIVIVTMFGCQVTAHNHAGSTTQLYQFTTLNAFGNPAMNRDGLAGVLQGLGFRASLSILVSVICLVLASLGVCFCIRKSK